MGVKAFTLDFENEDCVLLGGLAVYLAGDSDEFCMCEPRTTLNSCVVGRGHIRGEGSMHG